MRSTLTKAEPGESLWRPLPPESFPEPCIRALRCGLLTPESPTQTNLRVFGSDRRFLPPMEYLLDGQAWASPWWSPDVQARLSDQRKHAKWLRVLLAFVIDYQVRAHGREKPAFLSFRKIQEGFLGIARSTLAACGKLLSSGFADVLDIIPGESGERSRIATAYQVRHDAWRSKDDA